MFYRFFQLSSAHKKPIAVYSLIGHAHQRAYAKRDITCATLFAGLVCRTPWLAMNTKGCMAAKMLMKALKIINAHIQIIK